MALARPTELLDQWPYLRTGRLVSDGCMHAQPAEITVDGIDAPTPPLVLHWIPLGAGHSVVRANGKVFEAISAVAQRRDAQDLFHSALVVTVGGGHYTIEMAPVPDRRGDRRGVVGEGAVATRLLKPFRVFRYENRCWRGGTIPDLNTSVCPVQISVDSTTARRLVDLAPSVPTPVWGRDELRAGEMWNSNSVISWLLTRSGIAADEIEMPPNGRAPGWRAGIVVAERTNRTFGSSDSGRYAIASPTMSV